MNEYIAFWFWICVVKVAIWTLCKYDTASWTYNLVFPILCLLWHSIVVSSCMRHHGLEIRPDSKNFFSSTNEPNSYRLNCTVVQITGLYLLLDKPKRNQFSTESPSESIFFYRYTQTTEKYYLPTCIKEIKWNLWECNTIQDLKELIRIHHEPLTHRLIQNSRDSRVQVVVWSSGKFIEKLSDIR